MILVDDTIGLRYKLNPTEEEVKEGIVSYDTIKHANLWSYVTIDSVTYTNDAFLVDWDRDVQEWESITMGQQPFGNPLPKQEVIEIEDHELQSEQWPIDWENDSDDDGDDDVYSETEDEGFISDEET